MEPSPALSTAAEMHAYGLAWAESEITECWVAIHFDSAHDGSGGPYSVRVDVAIPGHMLVNQRVPHADAHLALGHAFQDMEGQLKAVDPQINHAEYAVTINGQLMAPDTFGKPMP